MIPSLHARPPTSRADEYCMQFKTFSDELFRPKTPNLLKLGLVLGLVCMQSCHKYVVRTNSA
jgi:hypothetical protein